MLRSDKIAKDYMFLNALGSSPQEDLTTYGRVKLNSQENRTVWFLERETLVIVKNDGQITYSYGHQTANDIIKY